MVQMWRTRKIGSTWSKCGARVKLTQHGPNVGTRKIGST